MKAYGWSYSSTHSLISSRYRWMVRFT